MSQMTDFIEAAQRDTEERAAESAKRSRPAPKGHHRLAINFDLETMQKLDDLMFARRVKTYKELVVALIDEAYENEVASNE